MRHTVYLLLSIFLISCNNEAKKTSLTLLKKPQLSIIKQHIAFEKVDTIFKNEVKNWKELTTVNSFIKKFERVSPNEALSNALELRDLVKELRDSIKPSIFTTPSFQARVNILYNETLRLSDLTLIPSITSKEVNTQINKTITAFSAVNSKINTLLSKKRFEEAIDIDLNHLGIDSTQIDSISKKTIDLKRKELSLKNKRLKSKPLNKKKQKKS